MSLRVWLPLNGDLKNKGLDDITVVNNGAIIDNNGKIGKCYSFDGTNDYINITNVNYPSIFAGSFSICFWIYSSTDGSRDVYFGNYGMSGSGNWLNIEKNTSNQLRFWWNNGAPNKYFTSYNILNEEGWTHVTLTRSENTIKVYKNGIFIDSYVTNLSNNVPTTATMFGIGGDSRHSGDLMLGGKINDFRIYDHALSLKQVQQISKGLVLHYKLDNNGMGGQNLLLNSKLDGSWEYPTTSYRNRYSPITVSIPDGDVYTLSFDAKSTVNGDKIRTHYYSPNTTTTCVSSQGVSLTAADGRMDFTLSTSWQRYWVIYNQSETTAVKHIICPRLWSGHGTGIVSVKNVKLEKGSIPTPWCPAKSELIDNNIIYDSSGYQNNGIIIGNIQPVNNSPKYITAMHFLATTQKILIQNLITTGFSNSYTFSWWGKINTFSGKMFWGFADGGIRLNGIYNGNLWNTGDSNNNPIYKPGTTTQVIVPSLNTWHHFVMVGNGTSCLVYLDGELWGQAKTYKPISGTKIYFNGWDSGTDYTTNDMAMSDFRIYATALSAEDIKELYQTSALIDRNQNLYVRELVEI